MGLNDNNDIYFAHNGAAPFDPNVLSYLAMYGCGNQVTPAEYNGWVKESLSWKKTCYFHSFLSLGMCEVRVKGPDAEALLSYMCVNGFTLEKFKIGRAKHIIACTPTGNIIQHGVCLRLAEDEFAVYNMEPIVNMYCNSGRWNVEKVNSTYDREFVFQIAGPNSLEVVENVIKQDVHDLKFMEFTYAKVLGYDVRVLRMGMGGTLSYEIHGTSDHMFEIYNEVCRVGKDYGMERLGWLVYMSNHTENGFVQNGEHFISDWETDPELSAYINKMDAIDFGNTYCPLHGSLAREGRHAYYLNVFEAGWGSSINWNHDFVGKEALLKIKEDPSTLRCVTLEWNREDILKIFDSFLDDEEGISHFMKFPQNMEENGCGSVASFQDRVEDADGNLIGKSTGRVYTPYYKKVISLGFVHPDHAKIGDEVTIIWGNDDERQIPVRAKIARFPYLDLTPNKDYDVESIPHYQG